MLLRSTDYYLVVVILRKLLTILGNLTSPVYKGRNWRPAPAYRSGLIRCLLTEFSEIVTCYERLDVLLSGTALENNPYVSLAFWRHPLSYMAAIDNDRNTVGVCIRRLQRHLADTVIAGAEGQALVRLARQTSLVVPQSPRLMKRTLHSGMSTTICKVAVFDVHRVTVEMAMAEVS